MIESKAFFKVRVLNYQLVILLITKLQLIFNHTMYLVLKPRTSNCTEFLAVNPFTAKVVKRYTAGSEYLFRNVPRLKILNLILNPNMSLGFWNKYFKKNAIKYNPRVKTNKLTYEFITCTPCTDSLPVSLSN